ncbi:MAG: DUF3883 domain-containing protein [Syntrophobacteraceae bacterium]|nr:DUF3883 domain-containing protein [Syntrophobacteraceae bacterium]
MGRTPSGTVKETGAKAGDILIGVQDVNRGLKIRLLGDQGKGHGGRVEPPFELVENGGYYQEYLAEYMGSTFSAKHLVRVVAAKVGKNNLMFLNCNNFEVLKESDSTLANIVPLQENFEGPTSEESQRSDRRIEVPIEEQGKTEVSDPDDIEVESPPPAAVGAGFGDSESNEEVEKAAVSFVTKLYRDEGWKVISVEKLKRGYDLVCTMDGMEEHVEVKGIRGTSLQFPITAGERKCAEEDPQWRIFILTSALDKPTSYQYSGQNFLKEFSFRTLQYMAKLKG